MSGTAVCKTTEMEIRVSRLRRAMNEAGLRTLLICATQTNKELVHYASNYRLIGKAAAVLIPEDREPALFISEDWDEARASQETWFSSVKAIKCGFWETVGRAARDSVKGRSSTEIGIAGMEQLTRAQLNAIACGLGSLGFQPATNVVEMAALVKTPYEIEILRRSARLADLGFAAMLNAARPGISEYEFLAEVEYAVHLNGGTDNFQLGATGRHNQAMIVPRARRLEVGDLILAEITPLIDSPTYAAQLCVTACLGPATKVQREKYALLVEALERALEIMKPGLPVQEIARVQNDVISKAGYAEYCRPPYMRSRGHNFGLGRVDIAMGSTIPLEEGMVLVIHPNQYLPETGYMACGETVLVTKSGIERLNKMTPSRIYEVEI